MKEKLCSVLAMLSMLAVATVAVATPAPSSPGDAPPVDRVPGSVIDGTSILNVDTGETFGSIQAAIADVDTMNGHTLQVQVPSHPEGLVTIDKSLTLRGLTGTETVMATTDTGSTGDARAWFLVNTGIDLTVENLGFNGNGRLIYQAFRHRGTGSFDNCSFTNIQYNPSSAYAGFGIVAFGGNVDITNCTFSGIGRVGVLAFGAGLTGSTIENNSYTGKGAGNWLDYGLEAGGGAVVIFRNNVISGNLGVAGDGSTSAGILVTTFFGPGTTADVVSNNLSGSSTGLFVGFDPRDTSTVNAFTNRIASNATGLQSTSNSVTTTAEDNWWGCNAGPGAAGCDPVTGLVDADPWLLLGIDAIPTVVTAGGFSDVTADLLIDSDGTDTSGLGTVPDNITVDFTATLGTVSPPTTGTSAGTAMTTFVANATSGTATVDATVDNQTVSIDIQIIGILAVPTASAIGLVLLVLVLAAVGWRRI